MIETSLLIRNKYVFKADPTSSPTTMLLSLPADVSLHVFAYLSLHDLSQVRVAARAVDQFFHTHEDSIYHQAAIYHRFVRPQTALEDAVILERNCLEGVRDWKELCRRRTVLEKNWDGHGYVQEGGYQPSEDTVLNFVIDEQERTAISLSRHGGLVVCALEDNRLLWALSKVRSLVDSTTSNHDVQVSLISETRSMLEHIGSTSLRAFLFVRRSMLVWRYGDVLAMSSRMLPSSSAADVPSQHPCNTPLSLPYVTSSYRRLLLRP